jgi:hypothetical protein
LKNIKKNNGNQDHKKEESCDLSPEVEAKLREKGINPETMTIDDLYPEKLDKEGNDTSLMSAVEVDIWTTYCKTRHYLADKYPQPKEANSPNQAGDCDEAPEIWIEKARHDPKSKEYIEALKKTVAIFDKVHVLQVHANHFEKICIRHYGFITYNWRHAINVKEYRSQLTDTDLFEAVNAYFKICQKYNVHTFEEPYWFLPEQRRLEIKLEGDILKRTGGYCENEVRISILEWV